MRSAISKSTEIHSSRSTRSQRVTTPVARSFTPTIKTSSSKGRARIAMVQGAQHYNLRKLPKRVVRSSSSSSSKTTSSRATPLQSGVQLASLSFFPSPRGVPNINDRGALKSYIGQVQRSVEGSKRYPEASRRAGREGKLKIQFTILKNGEVDNVKLLTETPYPNLNREAMAAVRRAAPFTRFPNSIMEQSLKVILPFRFNLN
jgi:TonB family protein